MQIIAVVNEKGGTGKSTTAAALAQAAAAQGKKALALDLNPQGNLSFSLGADMRQGTTFDLLEGRRAARLIQTSPTGPDVIPASRSNTTVTSSRGSAKRLRAALLPIQLAYDLIVIDTPNAMGELVYNALQAATGLLIPLLADLYSLQGLYEMVDLAAQMRESNPALTKTGIIITNYTARSNIDKQMHQNIIEAARDLNIEFYGTIRAGKDVREAQAFQQNLFTAAPKSKPAQDYIAVYNKIMEV